MSGTMFMRVSEVAEELGVSESYAYKLIQKLNKELKATGCLTLPGRIAVNFFTIIFMRPEQIVKRSDV